MKQNFYNSITRNAFATLVVIFGMILLPKVKAQGLVFNNSSLQSGTAGQLNAEYRFPSVTTGIDAIIKITGKSSNAVELGSIDLSNTGWDKAWQPQVNYNNGSTQGGIRDWYLEFTITFVNAANNMPVNPALVTFTALDIDGNGDKINEWLELYGHKNYTLENNSLLGYGSIWEQVNNVNTVVGTKFNGPVTNFENIDTAATRVMVTANFENKNSIRIRTGGHSTGASSAADRMYSFWFRSFSYQAAVNIGLPVSLKSFTAKLENKKPVLNWTSAKEENFSHYVLERSTDGNNFSDAAVIFANGNSTVESKYSFTDMAMAAINKGMIYYRLRMVDMDGKMKYSETRLLRLTDETKPASIQAYPNPVISELRITIPKAWQDEQVKYEIYTVTGQNVRTVTRSHANQTEVMNVSQLTAGTYIVKVMAGTEQATQQFVKSK